ncbi:hypothetical protein [Streptomyces sp. NPDC058371]|uniref:hypothetical protein n=1 Tax=Streptomyces sp. NPDC058371 TaxID=3346463 RepID=UPI00366750D7
MPILVAMLVAVVLQVVCTLLVAVASVSALLTTSAGARSAALPVFDLDLDLEYEPTATVSYAGPLAGIRMMGGAAGLIILTRRYPERRVDTALGRRDESRSPDSPSVFRTGQIEQITQITQIGAAQS